MREDQLLATAGHRFPDARVRVESYEDWLLREAVAADPVPEKALHPTAAFLAAQGGIGIADLFALFEVAAADGPMLGEWAVEFAQPLCPGADYVARAAIAAVERKHGARTGVFDLVVARTELCRPGGGAQAVVSSTYAFPRRTARPGLAAAGRRGPDGPALPSDRTGARAGPPDLPSGRQDAALRPGDRLPGLAVTADPARMRTMAALLRDPNMIHLDPRAAAAAGLGDRVVNQGPLNIGYVHTMLARWAGGAERVLASRFRLAGPVVAGERVVAGGRVAAVTAGRVECEVWLDAERNGSAERVLTGTAVVAPGAEP